MKATTKLIIALSGGVAFAGIAFWGTSSDVPTVVNQDSIAISSDHASPPEDRGFATSPSISVASERPRPVIPQIVSDSSAMAPSLPSPATQPFSTSSASLAAQTRKWSGGEKAVRRAYQVAIRAQENGMRLPAALMRAGIDPSRLSPQQQKILSSLEEEFLAEIDHAAAATPEMIDAQGNEAPPLPKEVWEQAREKADSRFRLFFGDEAYNYMSMEASLSGQKGQL